MTKEQFATRIDEIKRFMDEIDVLHSHIYAIAPGAVCEFGGRFLDDYIRLLSESVGDDADWSWVSWFVFDNEFGKKGLEAGFDGKMTKITSVDDLWDLITLDTVE